MAKLPDQFEFKTVRSIKNGEQLFVSAWALVVDLHGECYLDLDVKATPNPESYYKLRIERKDDQLIAYCGEMATQYDFKWKRSIAPDQVDLTRFRSVSQII